MAEPKEKSGFEDIEFTAEESGSLTTDQSTEDPKPAPEKKEKAATGEEAPAEIEEGAEEEIKETPDPDAEEPSEDQEALMEYDGKDYTLEELVDAIKDSTNKKSWQESNTQSAQKNADDRKVVDGFVDILAKLKNSDSEFAPDAIAAIREIVGEEEYDKAMGSIDGYSNSYKNTIGERDSEINDLKDELALINAKGTLREKTGITEKKADEVLEFALDKWKKGDGWVSLEDAYKLMNYDKVSAKAIAKKKAQRPKSAPARPGASEFKEKKKSTSNNPFDDIEFSSEESKNLRSG